MTGLHFNRCQAGQVEMLDNLYAEKTAPVPVRSAKAAAGRTVDKRPHRTRRGKVQRGKVGTALEARIGKTLGVKPKSTCKCKDLAAKMDNWGIAGCEQHRAEIVSALVANREVLEQALADKSWMLGFAAKLTPDTVLQVGANHLLDLAIKDATAVAPKRREKRQPRQRVQRRPSRKANPYSGWRSEADGPRIEHGPFESKIRHLTYFVYGKNENSWKWNLDQLSKRFWLFNGTKVLGISHDRESSDPQNVIDYAASRGMTFDNVLTRKNDPNLRETVLWVPMMECLNPLTADDNEVVFSAHAKGQKYDDPRHTRDWTDLMYQSCLDDWPSVYEALRTSLMAGSFREYGLLGRWHNWAYSGTFYWWRLQEVGKRNWRDVDKWFAGTESWPGKMCEARETACLFLNDSRRMYDAPYWESTVWPEWRKYKEKMRVL
jgi:hypothetical protein